MEVRQPAGRAAGGPPALVEHLRSNQARNLTVKRAILLLVPVAAAAALSVTPGQAAPVPVTRRCVVANRDCFIVRAGFRRLSPEARVNRLNDRLAYILGNENLSPQNVHVVQRREFGDIYVGRSHLFTATPEDAAASDRGGSTLDVANRWAAQLRKVLPEARPNANRHIPRRMPPGHGG